MINKNEKIIVYPNPTNGIINIGNQNIDYSIKITNIVGQIVYTENCKANKTTFDVSILTNGVYFITLQNDRNISNATFQKR